MRACRTHVSRRGATAYDDGRGRRAVGAPGAGQARPAGARAVSRFRPFPALSPDRCCAGENALSRFVVQPPRARGMHAIPSLDYEARPRRTAAPDADPDAQAIKELLLARWPLSVPVAELAEWRAHGTKASPAIAAATGRSGADRTLRRGPHRSLHTCRLVCRRLRGRASRGVLRGALDQPGK